MGFFHDRTRVRLWSRDHGAYVPADERGEIILRRDHGTTTLDEARPAHCLVRDADLYVLFYGAAYGRNLVQIVDGEYPGGGDHETNHAVQATQAPAPAAKGPAPPAMEFFPDRTHVWLWIREHEAYLYAGDEDGEEIAISGDLGAAPLCGAWAVHRLVRDDTDYVLFRSNSYGRNLALAEDEDEDEDEDEYDCTSTTPTIPRSRSGPWGGGWVRRNLLSNRRFGDRCHHHHDEVMTMQWVVETIPPRLLPPELPVPPEPIPPPEVTIGGPIRLQRLGAHGAHAVQPEPVLQRTIHYVRADDQGNFNQLQWRILEFDGQSLFKLRRDLAEELGEANNVLGITLCAWAGSNGRLTPLVIDLPSDENAMNIVVLNTESPDDIYSILPSRMALHGLPSQITEEQIGGMRIFLMCVGDQNFMNAFNACLEPIIGQVEEQNSYGDFLGTPCSKQYRTPAPLFLGQSASKCSTAETMDWEHFHGLVTQLHPKFYYAKRRFPVISKYRHSNVVLNIDEIKN